MADVAVILATRAHLKSIPDIELAASVLFSEADLPAVVRYRVTETADLIAAQKAKRLWVAVNEDGRTIGFAVADTVDGDAHLREVDVLPDYGMQGIGTRLVRAVVAWARNADFSSLALVTFNHLPWNAPFYAKLGFSILASHEYGPELTELLAEEKRLGINMDNRVVMRLVL